MNLCNSLKKIPLGIPLTIASVGTAASLFAGKRLHAGFGIAWTILSLWHGLQHHKKMAHDLQCLSPGQAFPAKAPASLLQDVLATIQIKSFTEGRLRVASPLFASSPKLRAQAEEYVRSFTGVTKAEANPLTGSLLIEYTPEKLRTKPKLAALEERIKNCI